MILQRTFLHKGFGAITAVILDTLMNSHVGLEICTFIKSFPANSAVVLVLSCVQLHVPLDTTLDGETFITQVRKLSRKHICIRYSTFKLKQYKLKRI